MEARNYNKIGNNPYWYKDLGYDSVEELQFQMWIDDCIKHGLIEKVEYQPKEYLLSKPIIMQYDDVKKTKTNIKEKLFIHKHHYTIDWNIKWTALARDLLFERYLHQDNKIIVKNSRIAFLAEGSSDFEVTSKIDVKGGFAGKNNTSAITYPLNAKWMFKDFGVYINKIIPKKLFEKTFAPARYFLNDTGNGPRRKSVVVDHKIVDGKRVEIKELRDIKTLGIYKTISEFINSKPKEVIENKLF